MLPDYLSACLSVHALVRVSLCQSGTWLMLHLKNAWRDFVNISFDTRKN